MSPSTVNRILLRGGLASALLLCCLLPAARGENLPVRAYTVADGLVHDQISRIMQDSHGFLWFCTTDGLSRFDGYRFTNYGVKEGLPSARINDILESRRSGVYWIATNDGGVSRFDPFAAPALNQNEPGRRVAGASESHRSLFQSYRIGDEMQSNIVLCLYEDRAGNIWFGTQGGLFRLAADAGHEVKFERVELGITSRADRVLEVQGIAEDREGSLWIATLFGLVRRLPDGRLLHHTVHPSQGTDNVLALMVDTEDRLWVGHQAGLLTVKALPADEAVRHGGSWRAASEGGQDKAAKNNSGGAGSGRVLLPAVPGEARWHTTTGGLAHNYIQSLSQTSDRRVWIGTLGGGVSVCDGERFRNYTTAHGLSARVNALAEDRDGNVWVGTQSSGALKIARSGFRSYVEADGLGSSDIISTFEDAAGDFYVVGARWTISRLDGERFASVRLNLPQRVLDASSRRWVVIKDRAGEWWAATGEGLYRFPRVNRLEELATAQPSAVYTTREGLADNNISRLFEDSRGDIWISSYNPPVMLTRFERSSGTFQRYAEADGLPSFNWANVFGEDASGQLWLGLHNGGLARLRDGRFEVFAAAENLPGGLGQGLYLDSARRLWFATSGGGVRVDDPAAERPRFVPLTTVEPLASNNLRSFAEDEQGRVYIGQARGVDRLDPRTGRIRHFTTADGLAKSEVLSAFRDRHGALWFGTREGLSRLVPEPDRARLAPRALIGGLRIAGVPYPISELGESSLSELVLDSEQKQIQIDFFSLDFSAGESLRYQYMIEGVSNDWSALTDQRTLTANLSPGTYRFLVRAVNADGKFSLQPASVSFRILRPVWQRPWFLLLAALVCGGIIFAVSRSRLKRLVELERVRTRIATDLHDDIGSSLSQIAILSEVVSQRVPQDNAPVIEPLSLIAGTSREMVDSMSDIVWAINPERDHLSDLTQRMRRFASDILSARDINFRFRAPDAEKDMRLGADLRREVYLIFKECVNNLVKHSQCTEAELEMRIVNGWIVLRISDDGRGFDTNPSASSGKNGDANGASLGGHGLASMRRRAVALGGTFEIKSERGRGTVSTLKVPARGGGGNLVQSGYRLRDGWRKLLHK